MKGTAHTNLTTTAINNYATSQVRHARLNHATLGAPNYCEHARLKPSKAATNIINDMQERAFIHLKGLAYAGTLGEKGTFQFSHPATRRSLGSCWIDFWNSRGEQPSPVLGCIPK